MSAAYWLPPPAVVQEQEALYGIGVYGERLDLDAFASEVADKGWETRWVVLGDKAPDQTLMLLMVVKPTTLKADVEFVIAAVNRGDFGKLTAGPTRIGN